MCGIFGSFNATKFEILDQANKQRGNFASGLLYHNSEEYDIQKKVVLIGIRSNYL